MYDFLHYFKRDVRMTCFFAHQEKVIVDFYSKVLKETIILWMNHEATGKECDY